VVATVSAAVVVNQDRPPNFRGEDGSLYLVRCFACGGEHGKENWAMAVASGQCAWCGWTEAK
jgi:hypothetical protein